MIPNWMYRIRRPDGVIEETTHPDYAERASKDGARVTAKQFQDAPEAEVDLNSEPGVKS